MSASTTIGAPDLVVEWPDGTEQWIALPGGSQWAPKEAFTIKDIGFEHPAGKHTTSDLASSGKLTLSLTVERDGKTSVDLSSVIIKP